MENKKKMKIMVISDHALAPSGVAHQTLQMILGCLKSGNFSFRCLGGAIKHENYTPVKVEQFDEDFIIFPTDGYGTPDLIRSMVRTERFDLIWIMTDPRFFTWLWDIENEIRPLVPIVYYHTWDNTPDPTFNKKFYESNDHIVTISKLTDGIVRRVAPNVSTEYLGHAVNDQIFKKHDPNIVAKFKFDNMKPKDRDKMVFFFNSRNARRKTSGSLIFWFKAFLDIVGHDKACLIMHTDVNDPNGQPLERIVEFLGILDGQVQFSKQKLTQEALSMMYNMSDATINVSDAEGFGLSVLESLSCATPVIATMTGGIQDQLTDGKEFFGIPIYPTAKTIIGSPDVPWIYEDRISQEAFVSALLQFYNMSPQARQELGRKGRQHVEKCFNFDHFQQRWPEIFQEVHERCGSWETRKNYKPYQFIKM